MIEGVDIAFSVPSDRDACVDCLRAISKVWPHGVVECADGDAPPVAIREFPPIESREVFVYRDAAAADAWRVDGGAPELSDAMIHCLREEGELTIVVGDPSHRQTSSILDGIRESLGVAASPDSAARRDARHAG